MSRRLRDWTWSRLAAHADSSAVNAARGIVDGVSRFLHAENHDFRTNGEARLLRCLGASASTILDVGANRGGWAGEAYRQCPDAVIYCFEVASPTRMQLHRNVAGTNRIRVAEYGLADRAGVQRIKFYPDRDVLASAYDYPHPDRSVWIEERVETGDAWAAEQGVHEVDLLKIDAEGADFRILTGFNGLLSSGAVSVVQFEYGFACILARALLIDFYEYLEPRGYVIGKVHPARVDFRPYRLRDENFFGPNFVAVHRDCSELIEQLARRGG